MVLANRLDWVVEDRAVLHQTLIHLSLTGQIAIVGEGEEAEPLYIGFTPVGPHGRIWADRFDAGFAQMRASGELAALQAKYGVTD